MRPRRETKRADRRRRPPVRSAFTLVEVLVAAVILSIGLLAFVSVALASRAAVDRGDYSTVAAQVAGDQIADLQGAGFAALSNGTSNYTVSNLPSGHMSVTVGYLDNNSANSNIAQVDVTVTWNAGSGATPQTAGSIHYTGLITNGL